MALRLANLGAALSVRHFGGALAAPGWGDIAAWWNEPGSKDPTLIENYAFLETILPDDDRPRGLQGDRHPGIPFRTLNDVSETHDDRTRATSASDRSASGGARPRAACVAGERNERK